MIKINQNIISNDSKTYFIADIAANFDGDIESKGLKYWVYKKNINTLKYINYTKQ